MSRPHARTVAAAMRQRYRSSMKRYTIRQLADEFGLTLRAVRFYEEKGLLQPSRTASTASARRIYGDEERSRLAEIVNLTKMGFTLGEIAGGNITDEQYRQQLSFCLERIAELEAAVRMIEERLDEPSAG